MKSGRYDIVNGTVMPATPGLSQLVAEQRDPVHGDRDQAGECQVLVHLHQLPVETRAAKQLARHQQPEADRGGDQAERDDARRAAREPPYVVVGVGAGHEINLRPTTW